VILPILVLASDFITFRAFFENRPETTAVNVVAFIQNGKTRLGIYRAHQLYLSLDDLDSQDFLADLPDSRNALVVSGFKDQRIASRLPS
jgi:hypothetical protein